MEYVYGTVTLDGVTRENLKIVGGGAVLQEGEYLTTVREYDDSTITDRCRIERHYDSTEGADGVRYDFYTIAEHYRYIDRTKTLDSTREATKIAFSTMAEAGSISPATAAEHADMFEAWAYPVDYKAGQMRENGGKLYECMKDHTSQAGWEPGSIGGATLWEHIDVEHAGTMDDPIPASVPMEYFAGKYYSEGEALYLCTRDSETPLNYLPSQLVGQYFEEVGAAE